MNDDLELRLVGASAPDGEIRFAGLVAIASSLQALSLRITRTCVSADRLGRPNDVVQEFAQLRLRGLSNGSTRLLVSRGPSDTLDIEPSERRDLDRKFAEVIEGVGQDERPSWVNDSIAECTEDFVKALQDAAQVVEARFAGVGRTVRIETWSIHRETWRRKSPTPSPSEVVVSGRLEAVDLRSGKFRVVDDVGNRIALDNVPDAAGTAHLINQRVRATGPAAHGDADRVRVLQASVVEADALPDAWSSLPAADLDAEFTKSGPTYGAGVELTDEEYADFLAMVKG